MLDLFCCKDTESFTRSVDAVTRVRGVAEGALVMLYRGHGGGFKPNDMPGGALGGAGRGAQGGAGRGTWIMIPQGGAGLGAQGAAQGGAARGSIQTYDELSP